MLVRPDGHRSLLFVLSGPIPAPSLAGGAVVGLTGLEPVTLRLSSACSNQLSYRPAVTTTPGKSTPFADLQETALLFNGRELPFFVAEENPERFAFST